MLGLAIACGPDPGAAIDAGPRDGATVDAIDGWVALDDTLGELLVFERR